MQAKTYRNNAHEFIAATAASAVVASLHWAKYSGSAPVFRAAILDKSGRRRSGFDQDAAARQTSAADALITHIDRGIRYFDPLNVKAMAIPHTTDPFSLFFLQIERPPTLAEKPTIRRRRSHRPQASS